jgi:hypothetical protein
MMNVAILESDSPEKQGREKLSATAKLKNLIPKRIPVRSVLYDFYLAGSGSLGAPAAPNASMRSRPSICPSRSASEPL